MVGDKANGNCPCDWCRKVAVSAIALGAAHSLPAVAACISSVANWMDRRRLES